MASGANSASRNSFVDLRPSGPAHITLLQIADAATIVAILWGTSAYFHIWAPHYLIAGCLATLAYLILGNQSGVYSSATGEGFASHMFKLFKVWGLVVTACAIAAYATKTSELYSRAAITAWFLLTPIALGVLHSLIHRLFRRLSKRGKELKKGVIVGVSPTAIELAKTLVERPELGLQLVGFYDDFPPPSGATASDLPAEVLGDLSQLVIDARSGCYDSVFLVGPMQSSSQLKLLVHDLAESHIVLRYIPDIFTLNILNSRISDVGGIPCINVYDSPLDGIGRVLKRIEDVVLATAILALIAIPLLIIAIVVKSSSRGPVLFRQKRYGYLSEPITVWKFRTMTVCEDGETAVQARKNDPRVTPLGGFLRKTSLDELPQFINVLLGQMSIVGPRPHPIALDEQFRQEIEGYMLRHVVKPGITGWAQINGWRGETDTLEKMEQRVQHDLHYIRNWSVWFDLEIIVFTVLKGFNDKNAF